jgi:hypothetical protein
LIRSAHDKPPPRAAQMESYSPRPVSNREFQQPARIFWPRGRKRWPMMIRSQPLSAAAMSLSLAGLFQNDALIDDRQTISGPGMHALVVGEIAYTFLPEPNPTPIPIPARSARRICLFTEAVQHRFGAFAIMSLAGCELQRHRPASASTSAWIAAFAGTTLRRQAAARAPMHRVSFGPLPFAPC